MLFANSDNDTIFPMDGNRRIIERLRQVLRDATASRTTWTSTSAKGGHDYRPDLRLAIFNFFNKHLKGDNGDGRRTPTSRRSTGKELRVFPEDKDLPKDAINAKADETFVPVAKVKLPEPRRTSRSGRRGW